MSHRAWQAPNSRGKGKEERSRSAERERRLGGGRVGEFHPRGERQEQGEWSGGAPHSAGWQQPCGERWREMETAPPKWHERQPRREMSKWEEREVYGPPTVQWGRTEGRGESRGRRYEAGGSRQKRRTEGGTLAQGAEQAREAREGMQRARAQLRATGLKGEAEAGMYAGEGGGEEVEQDVQCALMAWRGREEVGLRSGGRDGRREQGRKEQLLVQPVGAASAVMPAPAARRRCLCSRAYPCRMWALPLHPCMPLPPVGAASTAVPALAAHGRCPCSRASPCSPWELPLQPARRPPEPRVAPAARERRPANRPPSLLVAAPPGRRLYSSQRPQGAVSARRDAPRAPSLLLAAPPGHRPYSSRRPLGAVSARRVAPWTPSLLVSAPPGHRLYSS
ncbi:unnamed protein product [Closterium sp. NIES-64]|nr:unnamed protein product [Closterium sp. NIES-64]